MPFQWMEYLALARYLLGHGGHSFSQEAALRCAISRAYYAAFCHARNYARDYEGFRPTYRVNDHRLVREHFKSRGRAEVVATLESLRQWRNQCDYNDTVSNIPMMFISATNGAQKISDDLV